MNEQDQGCPPQVCPHPGVWLPWIPCLLPSRGMPWNRGSSVLFSAVQKVVAVECWSRGISRGTPEARSRLCVCRASFLMTFAPGTASGSFQMSQLFTPGGQGIGVSASTSVLQMNTQDWFPLGRTGWISLQSKGLSRVFSNTTVQTINSSVLSFLYSPTVTSIRDHWKNHSLD